ncbi:hypothetical protein D3C85_1306720 [compost metagenome]
MAAGEVEVVEQVAAGIGQGLVHRLGHAVHGFAQGGAHAAGGASGAADVVLQISLEGFAGIADGTGVTGKGFQVVGVEQEAVAAQGVLVHAFEHYAHEPGPFFVGLHAGIFAFQVGVNLLAVATGAVGIEERHAGALGDLLAVLGIGEYPQRRLGQGAEARGVLLHVRQRLGECEGL